MENKTNSKTHWKKHFNPNYLGSYSLDPGEEKVLTITELKDEEVTSPDGQTEILPVLHFKESKPLILNKTNAKTVAKVCGSDYVEDWTGKQIQVYAADVKAFGTVTKAIRVRPMAPAKKKLNKDQFEKLTNAIREKKFNKTDALARFDLTSDQRQKIEAI